MNSCLETLDEFGGWEDDLEIEALPSVRSATVLATIAYLSPWIHGPLTTILQPGILQAVQSPV